MLDRRALDREAHLWYLRPETLGDSDLPAYETWLTADERHAIGRLRAADDRRDRLLTKAVTRSLLSACTGVAPGAWRFHVDQHGKPMVEAPEPFRHLMFSVSHTNGLVACVLNTRRAVGVDVEHIDRPVGWREIASRRFNSTEIATLQRRPEPEQRRRFFELWTLKESYAKARGLGLRIPLDHTSFEVSDDRRVSVSFSEALRDDSRRWSFAVDMIGESHVMAAAVAEAGVRVVCTAGTIIRPA